MNDDDGLHGALCLAEEALADAQAMARAALQDAADLEGKWKPGDRPQRTRYDKALRAVRSALRNGFFVRSTRPRRSPGAER